MPTRSPLRLALTVALTVCLVLGAIPQAVAATPPGRGGSQMLAAPPAEATVVEFKHTGQSQSWQVPAGVTSIRVEVQGAQGGGVYGGFGARVQATLPVQPGQQLQVNVGGRGLGVNGGFNGGGDAGLGGRGVGGGGASDIRVAPYTLADRLVVAGGGGGAAPAATSIFGVGGSAGRNGQAGGDGSEDGQKGGGGGTQTQGGAGGDYAEPGRLGQGGKSGYYAGAGGGGYYGGGGGVGGTTRDGGGGGAGSSSVTTDADSVRWMRGFRPDDGLIVISYPPEEAEPPQPGGDTVRFGFTGGPQSWRVPAGVRSIRVDAFGAQGAGIDRTPASYGGFGARVQAIVEVEPEQLLTVFVGGKGDKHTGGFNGGGNAGLGGRGLAGGGASDVRAAGWRLEDRLVVAGGGGGAAPAATSIFGVGGSAGRNGQAGGDGSEDGQKGGGGGTQTQGGAGGDYAEPGRLGQGGKSGYKAGGGGGGYYGGGGGVGGTTGNGGGGGAGSSSVTPEATWARFLKGAHVGDGAIAITYPATTASASPRQPVSSSAFEFTGSAMLWRVPAGVRSIRVDAFGAQGAGIDETQASYGGFGARVQAIVEVEPEQLLTVLVGGKGDKTSGGFNGGGDGKLGWARGLAGGGASDVRAGGWRLEDRLVVAGGGGGAAPDAGPIFGVGGSAGDVGQGGGDSRSSKGGGGGTQTQGGAGGDYAEAGRLGQGGEGGYNAGAGGGGFYGGGGGSSGVSAGGGGGAGSSYVTPTATWSTPVLKGAHVGDGAITIRSPDKRSGGSGSRLFSIEEFKFTGKAAIHQVPEGSRFMGVDVRGAAGAAVGGVTVAAVPVKAGQQLAVVVGGKANRSTGGFNGGGSGAPGFTSGGGGASDVRAGGWRLEDRIAVAGGGGGTGRPGVVEGATVSPGAGGPGGGPFGGWGGSGIPVPAPGGGGGTQRGPGPSFDPVGTPAGLGYGASAYFGGAGGGGYYGGGSGSPNLVRSSGSTGGGGGGSGFYKGTGIPVSVGYNPGNGSVRLLLPTGGNRQKTVKLVRELLDLPAPPPVSPGRAI